MRFGAYQSSAAGADVGANADAFSTSCSCGLSRPLQVAGLTIELAGGESAVVWVASRWRLRSVREVGFDLAQDFALTARTKQSVEHALLLMR